MDIVEIDGATVRRLRQERRIPIAELAERVGIDRSRLVKIERGTFPRTHFRVLEALERELGTEENALVARADDSEGAA